MMPDDVGNFGITLNVGQDSLPNRRMLFHLATLFESERTWLLEQARR